MKGEELGQGAPLTIDLFCGAGGITQGFRQAGFQCVYANDLDGDASRTFKLNHPAAEVDSSPIEELNPRYVRLSMGLCKGELDCLTGGPPCQGFSINAPERFLDDPRNALFRNFVAFVKEFQPKTVLFENVPGMLSLNDGLVVGRVVKEIAALGYSVGAKILFSAHYGVPQERWRLILLAASNRYIAKYPDPTHFATARANFTGGRNLTFRLTEEQSGSLQRMVTVRDALHDLPPLESGGGEDVMEYSVEPHSKYAELMREKSKLIRHHVSSKIAPINLHRLRHIPPGGSWRDIPYELLPSWMKKARRSDHTKRYGRLDPGGLAGTVMTKMDPHWGPAFHYEQDRTLTVREAARLQSFPDT